MVVAFVAGRISEHPPGTPDSTPLQPAHPEPGGHSPTHPANSRPGTGTFNTTGTAPQASFAAYRHGPSGADIASLFKSRDPLDRLSNFVEVLGDLGPHSIKRVKAAFETLQPGAGRNQEMQLLFHAWAKFAPKDAIAYGQALGKSESSFAVRAALASWASYDAPAAMEWIEQEPKQSLRQQYQVGVIQGVSTFDIDAATDLLYGMDGSNYRFQASSVLVKNLAAGDLARAMDWAAGFPDGDTHLRTTVLGQVANEVARHDPERCAKWALTLEEGESRKRIVSTVINYWSRKSYKDTAAWVQQLPEGDNRYYAIEQMVNQWAWRNPVDTADWLNQFPSSDKLDPAIDNFARRIMHKEPATAADWAKSITDAGRRAKSLDNVFKSWKKRKPDEALAWAQANAPELLPRPPQE